MAYHHGDLPTALRTATAALVEERGTSGFSLREVARRAGVSHGAPQHHFGDARGLLTSVAAEGFGRLRDAFREALGDEGDATQRLERCGLAYVTVALENPGHIAVMLRPDLVDADDPDLADVGGAAYEILVEVVEGVRDECNPDLDVETAALMCWSLMQGLVELLPKQASGAIAPTGDDPSVETLVRDFTRLLIDGFAKR